MSKQMAEENSEPTTFEIPAGHVALELRDQHDAATDLANAELTTLRRKHQRRVNELAAELQAEMDKVRQPLKNKLDQMFEDMQIQISDVVPFNLTTQKAVFVSSREVKIVDRDDDSDDDDTPNTCNCAYCRTKRGEDVTQPPQGKGPGGLLQALFGL